MTADKASLLIIYTGGTIGMVHSGEHGSLKPLPFENLLEEVPELSRVKCKLESIAFENPVDSSNIDIASWVRIAEIIEQNYESYDGFVILHGTDTMAYTASVLSFMLEGLSKPVILTGSQLPISTLRTDAKENFITAVEIAADQTDGLPTVPEVAIFFQNKLFRGNRTTKHNAEEFRAFQSFNYPPLAEFGVHVKYYHQHISKYDPKKKLVVNKKLDNHVSVLKIFPGMNPKIVEAALGVEGLKAMVLETYGAGNAPNAPWFLEVVTKAVENGVLILNVSQCSEGMVEMGMYETGTELEKAGVIGGSDITTEAALAKLMHLLGKNTSKAEIIKDLNKSICGEISK